jgi:Ni,Fe-hydrogenase III component G
MPTCSPLFVDKIALTIALDDETARDNISNWFHDDSPRLQGYEVSRTRGGRFYWYSKKIIFDDDRECSVLVRIPVKLDSDSTPSWTDIPEQAGQSERSDAGFWVFTLLMSWGSSFCRAM